MKIETILDNMILSKLNFLKVAFILWLCGENVLVLGRYMIKKFSAMLSIALKQLVKKKKLEKKCGKKVTDESR